MQRMFISKALLSAADTNQHSKTSQQFSFMGALPSGEAMGKWEGRPLSNATSKKDNPVLKNVTVNNAGKKRIIVSQ